MKAVVIFAALLAVATFAACGGSGGPGETPTTPPASGWATATPSGGQATAARETPTPTAEARKSTLGESPDDILRLLRQPYEEVTVLYLDVPQAIEALSRHAVVRDELVERWDYWGLSDEFGIDLRDLDYIAFGENGSPNSDLFLLGGVDFGDLRDALEYAGMENIAAVDGAEIWMEGEDYDGDWPGVAFLGDAVVIADHVHRMVDSLMHFKGDYALAQDVLRRAAAGEAEGKEVLSVLAENEGALVSLLWRLASEELDYDLRLDSGGGTVLKEWMRVDLFHRYVGDEADQTFRDWETPGTSPWYVKAHLDFAGWLQGNRDALEDFAHWLAGDPDTMNDSIRQLVADQEVDGYLPPLPEACCRMSGQSVFVDIETVGDDFELYVGEYEDSSEARAALARWDDGDDEALSHVWPEIAGETRLLLDSILSSIRSDISNVSLYDRAGGLWTELPLGVLKQMSVLGCDGSFSGCQRFVQAISPEGGQQFRLTATLEYPSAQEARDTFEDLEADDIHDACEASFELDGTAIMVDALCDIEALARLVDVD